jgi:hypothetical protein
MEALNRKYRSMGGGIMNYKLLAAVLIFSFGMLSQSLMAMESE